MKDWKQCETCGSDHKKKRFCSQRCYWDSMKGLKNELAPAWKEGKVSLTGVHMWLNANYGKPKECDFCGDGNSNWFDWAKKQGREYVKDREAFHRLCRSCHKKYDFTPEMKEKAVKNLKWYKAHV